MKGFRNLWQITIPLRTNNLATTGRHKVSYRSVLYWYPDKCFSSEAGAFPGKRMGRSSILTLASFVFDNGGVRLLGSPFALNAFTTLAAGVWGFSATGGLRLDLETLEVVVFSANRAALSSPGDVLSLPSGFGRSRFIAYCAATLLSSFAQSRSGVRTVSLCRGAGCWTPSLDDLKHQQETDNCYLTRHKQQ